MHPLAITDMPFSETVMSSLMYQEQDLVTLRISHQGDLRLGKSPCAVEVSHLYFLSV